MNDMRFKDLLIAQYVNAMENRLELALLNKALMVNIDNKLRNFEL